MINNAVAFNAEQLKQIKHKKITAKFSNNSWSDEDLHNLKTLIKKHYIFEQDAICPYCQQNIRSSNGRYWDIEHIIPRATSPYFMFEPLNLCISCIDCNNAKSNKKVTNSNAQKHYPIRSKDYLIVHPHFDNYEEHILVIRAGYYYVARKPKGEKTISICRLNRFYGLAGYGKAANVEERLVMLSNQLIETKNIDVKNEIFKEIAALSIQSVA